MMRFAASISSRGPIKREPPGKQRIIKCADERLTHHDSIGLAKADGMAAPRPPLPTQSIVR